MKTSTTIATVNRKLLFIIAFFEGAAVMAVELVGAKMVGPYYGNSLYVWASVLGLTLVGLASGYFVGGYASKKIENNKLLYSVLFFAAVLILIMPQWGAFVMEKNMDVSFVTGTVISGFLFLLPPLFCLGMVSPIIINLMTGQEQIAGKVSGTVYGVSTIGGVFMTFFIAFYLIPVYGLKLSAYCTGFLLIAFSLIHFVRARKGVPVVLFFLTIIVMAAKAKDVIALPSNEKVLYKNDGILGQVLVTEDSNAGKRTLYVNNIPQTLMHIATGRSLWRYIHRISLCASVKPAGSKVLVCGLGGGALAAELKNLGLEVEFVELDQRIADTAKEFFQLDPSAQVTIDDARHFINSCTKQYDILIIDTSAGETQPLNVYTVECFEKLNKLLKEDGMLLVHYQNSIEGDGSVATRSIGKTIQKAGFQVKLLNTRENLTEINEVMFFGSKKDLDLEKEAFERRDRFGDPYKFSTGNKLFIKGYDFKKGFVLTDDCPKMDFLHQNTIKVTREGAMKRALTSI
jgi:predicted membrane-bound spermidine synthase